MILLNDVVDELKLTALLFCFYIITGRVVKVQLFAFSIELFTESFELFMKHSVNNSPNHSEENEYHHQRNHKIHHFYYY